MATRKTTKKTTTSVSSTQSPVSKLPIKSLLIPVLIIGIVVVLLWLLRGQLVAATVNGEPISRISLLLDLEKKQGKSALENLITEKLILQEAAAKKITATDSEIDAEIGKIDTSLKSQGQELEPLLAAQGMTREDLNNQLKFQVLLQKMAGKTTVTDSEIEKYMEDNKEILPESTDAAELKNQVKAQLEQQKAQEQIQKIVADLRAKAKINYLLKL